MNIKVSPRPSKREKIVINLKKPLLPAPGPDARADTVKALRTLGFRKSDAVTAANYVFKETPSITAENAVKACLEIL